MKKHYYRPRLILYAFFVISILGISCTKNINKQISNKQDKIKESNRLKFNTYEDFRKTVTLAQEKGYEKVSEILVENSIANPQFISLRESTNRITNSSSTTTIRSPDPNGLYELEQYEDLVPDPVFAGLLDDRAEIEVQGKVYKVTKFGTYVYTPEQENEVLSIIADMEANSIELTSENRILPGEVFIGNDLYLYSSGIQRYDSYVDIQTSYIPTTPPVSSNNQPTFDTPNPNFLLQSVYDGFPVYNYDANTWVGGLIQDIFGRTKPHHEYFDSKNRVKVNFYNVDFMIYASAGINVKMQRKGWTGIWRKLDAEELRIGWDGLIYEVSINNMPAPQSYDLDFNKVKFNNFEFDVKGFTILGQNVSSELNNVLNQAKTKGFQQGLKEIWQEVKKFAPSQWKAHDNYVKAFRIIYPNKIKIISDRYEDIQSNTDMINKNFDWNTYVVFKIDPAKVSSINWENVWKHISGKAYTYKILGASIYGAAKYNGTWKGVRIDKAFE